MKPERLTYSEIDKKAQMDDASYDEHLNNCYRKLAELENIEEELGVGIVTLHKALKNGIYVYTKRYGILFCKYPCLRLDTPKPIFDISSDYWLPLIAVDLNKYGMKINGGWALTKKELE